MRSLWAVAYVALCALTACSAAVPYELVCAPNDVERLSAEECVAAAQAVISDLGGSADAEIVTVQAFRSCPPGAYCGLQREETPAPLSALVGVRLEDGTSFMSHVSDVSAPPLETEAILGYDPDEFIDGLARSIGTLRP